MPQHKVMNYESGQVHWAKARNMELAKNLSPEDVTLESWWHWHTLCGKDIIAHATAGSMYGDRDVSCQVCVRTYAKDQETYRQLMERYG